MNKIILCCFAVLLATASNGQTDSTRMYTQAIVSPEDSVLENLVRMALLNPRIRSAENTAIANEYLYRRDRTAWMNNLSVAGNLNEYSIKGNQSTGEFRQNFYPRYNIGVNIPLGLFVNNKKVANSSLARYNSSVDQIKMEEQQIRREVTILYEQHQMTEVLIQLQEDLIDDAKIVFTRNEQRFEAGEIKLDDYSAAVRSLNAEKVKQVNLQFTLSQNEAYMEELIGMKYTDAIYQINIRLTGR